MKRPAFLLVLGALIGQASAAYYADVAFVVDQSGSMGGEFNWIGSSISDIDAQFTAEGITANWGVAGYEFDAGTDYYQNAWRDLSGSVGGVVNEVNNVSVYGGTERHYHAADWAADNFGWTGGDHARVMVLITDERGDYLSSYQYNGLYGEAALAQKMNDEDILLNVITFSNYSSFSSVWDDVVYSVADNPATPEDETYAGLFDLEYLRTDAAGFTADFTAAKIQEIKEYTVPEPSMLALFGFGLIGLLGAKSRNRKK